MSDAGSSSGAGSIGAAFDAGGVTSPRATIILGVTGSIAAYKAAEVASTLFQRGHDVHVVMTDAATRLITPATFYPLTGNPVHHDLWDPEATRGGARVEHVGLADRAHVFAIAPATANVIGQIASGIADDFLTTLLLAFPGPVLLAPAMNDNMYRHPAVRRNLDTLRGFGYRFIDPEEGELACGRRGLGRLAEPQRIADAIEAVALEEVAARVALEAAGASDPVGTKLASLRRSLLAKGIELGAPIGAPIGEPLGAPSAAPAGRPASRPVSRRRADRPLRVLVTAGPTREALDDVRVLTNASSGRMGDAVAAALLDRGHAVTLVRGPVDRAPPEGVDVVSVTTTESMRAACVDRFAGADAVVMAAAPCDFRPVERHAGKLKKRSAGESALVLRLEPTPDILRELGQRKGPGQRLVGFALEADDGEAHALAKLREKHLDLIVLNGPANLGADRGEAVLLGPDGPRERLAGSKADIARAIVGALEGLFAEAPRGAGAIP